MPAHSVVERLRWWWFGAAIILFALAVGRVVSPLFTNAQAGAQAQSAAAGDNSVCRKVGNNPAVPFPDAVSKNTFNEADYTLGLLVAMSDVPSIVQAINSYSGTVVVRHFGGGGGKGLSATDYGNALNIIAGQVGGKRFIAHASHNEANCGEYDPLEAEHTFAQTVVNTVTAPNVELIGGQIDFFCGKPPGAPPAAYLNMMQDLRDTDGSVALKGIALPFYTGVTGDRNGNGTAGDGADTDAAFDEFAANVRPNFPIYVTEVGPLRGTFREFADGMKRLTADPKVKGVLLFNSHGVNNQSNSLFSFTRPFWNSECRKALREVCQDVDAVVKACGENETAGSTNNYYEYNLKRDDPAQMVDRLTDTYSLACLPKSTFRLEVSNEKDCGFVGCEGYKPTAKLTLDAKNSVFGLFRDEDRVLGRVRGDRLDAGGRQESIESFFSSRTALDNPAFNPNSLEYPQDQAPIYKLTTQSAQCQASYYTLVHINSLCQENLNTTGGGGFANTPTCALDKKVGVSRFSHNSLLSEFDGARGGQTVASYCDTITRQPDNELATAMLQVNSSLELAYRPAFIAFLAHMSPKDPAELGAGRKFIYPGNDGGTNKDFVLFDYVEVRVPDFGSDRPVDDPNTDRDNYQDPLRQTANLFLTKDQIDTFNQKYAEQREALKASKDAIQFDDPEVAMFVRPSDGGLPIRCIDDDGNLQGCENDPVARALLHFMNASLKAEVPKDVPGMITGAYNAENYSYCELKEESFYEGDSEQQKKRLAEEAASINSSLEPKDVGGFDKKSKTEFNVGADLNLPQPQDGGTLGVKAVFITPHNYTLALADRAFMTQATKEQQDMSNPIWKALADRFPGVLRSNDAWDLESGEGANRQLDMPSPTPKINVSVNMAPAPNGDKPTFNSFLQRTAARVASVPTRLFTLLNTSPNHPLNLFTRGCELSNATEGWLQGNCTPAAAAPPKTQDVSGGQVTSAAGAGLCIEVFVTDTQKLQQYAANIKQSLSDPAGRDLWDRYYAGYKRGGYQHLFGQCTIEGQVGTCYERVVDALVKSKINPYLGIAIALNETGGLKSESASNEYGPHWGCGWDGTQITSGRIENKFNCMKGFFIDNHSLSDDASLLRYGYKGGYNNANLSKIIGLIDRYNDGPAYDGCARSDSSSGDTNAPTAPTRTQ